MKIKQSIKQSVYHTLKDAILLRKLAPGKQIVETTISEQLNISRTPIRSAINLLASEGLVEIIPNKGAFVINPTLDEVHQAYHLRKELEIMAATLAIDFLTEDDFEKMERIIASEKEALFNKNLINYINANQKFHLAITNKSGNKFLNEFVEKLVKQTSVYLILFDIFFEEDAPPPYGYNEHLEIITLLKQKDQQALSIALRNHFDNAISSLNININYEDLNTIFKNDSKEAGT